MFSKGLVGIYGIHVNVKTFINATLELESAIQQYQRAEAKLGGAVTTISKKVDTINQHIDKVLENAPTKLKVTVNVNDADWQKIQELFAKERQWMNSEMQMHIREIIPCLLMNGRKSVNATRNMMVVTLVTIPSGSSGSSSRLVSLWLLEV